ncbi:peptidase domain-containing ABC transporter [Hymenobacter sp. BT18]|uniref:peptidase domain-containing ABC transporter n=1 Tax=Hymenobacter sp. BT18 TaxID=2835648 RepID=UPI00143E6937|nr:peptidase domain-containing ABC transporter [Hymenobacter sp. BT18]QIX60666.1 peptidase domain-containing ABC transporter [Hymenobacter sp. BT18]
MKKSTLIRQRDITDCGAACLASVAAHYHLLLPVARIRQYASTDQKGTNVLGMINAAEKIGFQAKGVKGGPDSLEKIPKPAIAHVVVQEKLHHYVVIYAVSRTHVTVMDPADGRMHKHTLEEFTKEWSGVLMLLLPDTSFRAANEKTSSLKRFWQLIQPHRSVMLQALVGAALYTILGLSMSIYVQKIVDNVLVEGNHNLLNVMSVAMVAILLLQLVVGTVKSFFVLKTGQQLDAGLIMGYYNHLLRLPQTFFDTMRVGEIISRVNDAVKIRAFVNDAAINVLVNLFIVAFSFALMFTYYWKLALIIMTIIPLYAVIYLIMNRLNRRYQRQLMESGAELQSQMVESLGAMSTIKGFGMEEFASVRTETRFVQLLRLVYTSGRQSILGGAASEFVSQVFKVILLWVGAYFVLGNQLTPGELLSFYALIGYFTGPATSLIGANKTVQDALIAADRLFEVIDLERESLEHKTALTKELVGDIRFSNVAFSYGTRTTVFENLSLSIRKGTITGIVGESGSGKTTLLALLQGIYPLKSGSIGIGDLNLQHVHPDSLRRVVSVVPQQVDLFTGNIIENIAVGDYSPDMGRLIRICQQLGMLEFIEKLPAGFGTQLGEHGTGLSGGQKQRLAIARALYRDPEILILDEATSALDGNSEHYVQQTIQHLRAAGKTVIIIAHRLSTVMGADKIVVLAAGKLVEEGTHAELMLAEGHYHRMWHQLLPPSLYAVAPSVSSSPSLN